MLRNFYVRTLGAASLCGALFLGFGWAAAELPHAFGDSPVKATPEKGASFASSLSATFRTVARDVQPSVVMIKTETPDEQPSVQRFEKRFGPGIDPSDRSPFGGESLEELFRSHPEMKRFFRPSAYAQPTGGGIGSGVIIDSAGVILTNNHVVRGGGEITVRLHDGREFRAQEVKTDPKTDLAIIRIQADDLVAAPLGDSDIVEVGDWVLALGQPFGLEGTVTAGIISAKGRGIGIADRENWLQTDAAINPGNSGGPLVNLDGEVVGINTAISSSSGGNQGVGFAAPINLAKWVASQLESSGVVQRAFLGVGIQPLTHELASSFGVKTGQGVLVSSVVEDSPAAHAGLQQGDVILSFSGHSVAHPRELQNAVERCPISSQQKMEIIRDGKPMTLTATCGGQAETASPVALQDASSAQAPLNRWGLQIAPLTADVAKELGMESTAGVVVADVATSGAAAKAGLARGDVILEAGRQPVNSPEAFEKALDGVDRVLLLVKSGNGSRFLVLHPQS
ncbi:Do family serine endopeptidase [Lignipirellula cremea]|uniref:Putative periplasmic serine endoprotease DegP-like n=1 Tax=Lignipirellula cremea TaxID=2528010 RepID=A0A518E065_9BACT|nr:Do family serine endopeptidase [Lignipirellula cremea]QDU97478.1 putative periplasmic serine endoprotease DegP-like precursor [Lignipirellula cremea]